ncbi:MAG: FAD-binding protein [Sedimentisphaerales bacterium]|jgi:succinate dehydrogenase/fumarate reductase flavoprotein subunit
MESVKIGKQKIIVHRFNTVIVGAGAAGMNAAIHLYEFFTQKAILDAQDRIAVVTAGVSLGASRMSGSDKQTYYKMGTSPDVPDSAEAFAKSITAAGCCHGDLALAEAVGSLREFYHLVQAGVPFPHDSTGSFLGYKTDHDPSALSETSPTGGYERATSAGPKTSKLMSECLQRQVVGCGIKIYDQQEVAHLLTAGSFDKLRAGKRIIGVVTIDKKSLNTKNFGINIFLCENLILAAGGPGELYNASVYPKNQSGIHGLAFQAGLPAENLTESQFGLASTKFRWNVSGTYMQAVPRIFSTDADGNDEREFLADYFPSMSKMATDIFLKGYQWPFDPQRIENYQSSLIDVLVFNETQKGRRVFMDFLKNPIGNSNMKPFAIEDLEEEALAYLRKTGALQKTPIERLAQMNQPAIDIYAEHGINLRKEPLGIAVCAQHNNGGFAVNHWWESSIPRTFVVGEMAGTHGVKRPGGSALNSGQTGSLRAAEFIANVYGAGVPSKKSAAKEIKTQVSELIERFTGFGQSKGLKAKDVIAEIQARMTASAGHIREINDARNALTNAIALVNRIKGEGISISSPKDTPAAVRAEHLALTSVAYLKAIVSLLEQGSGSRGSHLVLSSDGIAVHSSVLDKNGSELRYKPENAGLRNSILRVEYDPQLPNLFRCQTVTPRPIPTERKAFEPAWKDYREGKIYG